MDADNLALEHDPSNMFGRGNKLTLNDGQINFNSTNQYMRDIDGKIPLSKNLTGEPG